MKSNRHPDPCFERLRKTLFCAQADRVPLAEITIDEAAKEAFLGKPLNDLSTDIEFYVRAHYDYIPLGRRISGFPPVWGAARLENYYEVQRQVAHGRSSGILSDWDDFRCYPWINCSDLDFRILDKAEKILPKEMKVVRYLSPVFQMTWALMGFENFCHKLADDPVLVEAVSEKIFEIVSAEFDDALQRDVVGAVWYGDDIAIKDRLLVSPAILRKVFFPKLKFFGDGCKKRGIPLIYHTDGDVSQVLQDIIDSGVKALHPIDPLGMNIYEVKKEVAGRLCVIGNIDVDLLFRGTAEAVEEETKTHLKLLGPGGGYVMGSSNSIPRATRIENYRAMIETTLRYGAYPVDTA